MQLDSICPKALWLLAQALQKDPFAMLLCWTGLLIESSRTKTSAERSELKPVRCSCITASDFIIAVVSGDALILKPPSSRSHLLKHAAPKLEPAARNKAGTTVCYQRNSLLICVLSLG